MNGQGEKPRPSGRGAVTRFNDELSEIVAKLRSYGGMEAAA